MEKGKVKGEWKQRASKYNKLEWVNKKSILNSFIALSNFRSSDTVLDLGCGTGTVICAIYNLIKEPHGIDISDEMMSIIDKNKYPLLNLKCGSSTDLPYPNDKFDKITVRSVFHHIIDPEDQRKTLKECYRVLKSKGRIIIAEGVPPHNDLKKDFEDIYNLKEERVTFLPDEIKDLLFNAGFKNIRINLVMNEDMSLKNWLENDGKLTREIMDKIYDMHLNGSDFFKRENNVRCTKDDILIDVKVAIIIGEK